NLVDSVGFLWCLFLFGFSRSLVHKKIHLQIRHIVGVRPFCLWVPTLLSCQSDDVIRFFPFGLVHFGWWIVDFGDRLKSLYFGDGAARNRYQKIESCAIL